MTEKEYREIRRTRMREERLRIRNARRRRFRALMFDFIKKIKDPPDWIVFSTYATLILAFPITYAAFSIENGNGVYAILFGLLHLLVFAYSLFVTGILIKKARRKMLRVADKFKFTRRMHENYGFRTIVFSVCAFLGNIGYTVFLVYMSFSIRSVWYATLALFYFLLTFTLGGILIENAKNEKALKDDSVRLQRERANLCFFCGVMSIALTIVLFVAVAQMTQFGVGFHAPEGVTIYIFAGFSVYRFGMGIYNLFKSGACEELIVRSICSLNLTAALFSVLTLQTAILDTVPLSFDPKNINAITGGIVCFSIAVLGVRLLFFAIRERRKWNMEDDEPMEEENVSKETEENM